VRSKRILILVRHGQSEHHVLRLTGGWTDTPLTPLGHDQAQRVAARLRDELAGADVRLYASDLERAMQTAGHIGAALGVKPIADERLREHNNGDAVGLTMDEARVRFADSWDIDWGLDIRPFPNAETWREFFERTAPFIDERENDDAVTIAVTHGGTILNLVARWLMLPAEAIASAGFDAHPTSLFVLRSDKRGQRIAERMNDTAHLDGTPGHVTIGALVRGEGP
jgi:probable phosphoglycerate mutase